MGAKKFQDIDCSSEQAQKQLRTHQRPAVEPVANGPPAEPLLAPSNGSSREPASAEGCMSPRK